MDAQDVVDGIRLVGGIYYRSSGDTEPERHVWRW